MQYQPREMNALYGLDAFEYFRNSIGIVHIMQRFALMKSTHNHRIKWRPCNRYGVVGLEQVGW